ncbi:hypothetical protein FE697_007920 [Mumia zhuanghuii]|uniref:Uncharacterized protein n=2 Tax=Mumia TaxID=1546255 RepID=A0ABW1QLE5_9ACTN|nr:MULTISPECIES: hypothetical protein [Mumia]KAA1423517.1 hypothetical protein FE697_007920 [Mumia zhuanghuii]
MAVPPSGDPVGSLAQEAIKLARALADQADDGARTHGAHPDHDAQRPESCDFCPLCQLITVVRSARPEVAEHLTAALASLTLAARGVVESWGRQEPPDGPGPSDEGLQDNDVKDGPWE